MRGKAATPDELRRRSASCQWQRQKLLRAAVENSTSRWALEVYSTRCSLPALASLWRQQTGGGCDFENFAQRVVRRSRSRLRSPSETSVGSSRRSASEPRLWVPQQAAAPPAGQKRRHSVAVPVLPVAICGPYVCVAPTASKPAAHGTSKADQIHRTQMHRSGEQMQRDYPGVCHVDTQQIRLLPRAMPVLLLCRVGMAPARQWIAPSAAAPVETSAGRGETAHKWAHTEASQSSGRRDPSRRNSSGDIGQVQHTATASKVQRSRTRTLPGNFAQLEKSWTSNAGSQVKSPSKNIRL
ncbi:uncharacterized protein LOC126298569 isoform X2 [Schistocerca gregaria]|nr:uncharacterized protein LOC126298569 isoform X2 [Schistocerca gregaria]